MSRTRILVANASRARFFENTGIKQGLHLVAEQDHPESRMKRADLVTDRPGHMQSVGNGQGSRQPAIDPKSNEAEHFAQEIAKTLESDRARNKYDRLILVASAPFLGTLKAKLSDQVKNLTSDIIEKDYTLATEKELGDHLQHCIYL